MPESKNIFQKRHTMKPPKNSDDASSFAVYIDTVISRFPATTLSLLRKIDDKYGDNITIRLAQELIVYDEFLYEWLAESEQDTVSFFAAINDFLNLCIEFIRVGDELPVYLVGDYYIMTVHDNRVYDTLRNALEPALEFAKADKYAGIADVSTDIFVAVLSTTYDFVVA